MADVVLSAYATYLRGMYLRGTLTDAGLDAAVTKGRITQEEADAIRAAKVAQDAAIVASTDAAVVQDLNS